MFNEKTFAFLLFLRNFNVSKMCPLWKLSGVSKDWKETKSRKLLEKTWDSFPQWQFSKIMIISQPRYIHFLFRYLQFYLDSYVCLVLWFTWFCHLLKKFYCYSITVVCIFSPSLHATPAEPTSLPGLHLPWFCPCVLYSIVPVNSSPHCPLPIPLWLLLDCS